MDNLNQISDVAEKQKTRFKQGLGADIAFLVLVVLLIFANWYVGAYGTSKTGSEPNPEEVRILIYAILGFCTGWDVYEIVKNSLGWYAINEFQNNIGAVRETKSLVLKIRTSWMLSGFLYDVIDKMLSEYSQPLAFHMTKKKENLLSLNIRWAFWEFLFLAASIAWFVGDYVVTGFAGEYAWTTILGLVVFILCVIFVFGYMIPRQVLINKQIKLNDQKKISEDEYYNLPKFFYTEKVLTKFWNRDNK